MSRLRRWRRRLGLWVAGRRVGPPPPPPGRARRAGRWALRISLGGLALLVLARLLTPLVLPSILDAALGGLGLAARYERLELSLLTGDLAVRGLEVVPAEGGAPILSAAHVQVDVAPLALLGGRLRFRRLALDQVDALLDREPDGTLAIVRRIERARAGRPEEPPEPEEEEERGGGGPSPLRRLAVEALRVERLHLRVRDPSVAPAVDLHAYLDLRVSDFDVAAGPGARPTRLEVVLRAPPALSALSIDGTLRAAGPDANAALEVALDGLSLAPLRGWLEPLGLRPAAARIDAGVSVRARPHGALAGPGAAAGWDVVLEGLRASADDRECAAVDRVTLEASALGGDALAIARAAIEGVRARAERTPEGAIRVAGLDLAPPPRRRAPEAGPAGAWTAAPAAAPAATAPAGSPRAPRNGGRFRVTAEEVELSDLRASFRDDAVDPPASLAVRLLHGSAGRLVIDPETPAVPAPIDLRLTAPGLAQRIVVTGTALLAGPSKALEMHVALEEIAPHAAAPYLEAAGVESALESGRLTARVRAGVGLSPGGGLALEGAVLGLSLEDRGAPLASLEAARVAARVDLGARRVEVSSAEVVRPRTRARRDASGVLHAAGLRLRPGAGPSRDAPDPRAAEGAAATPGPRAAPAPASIAPAATTATASARASSPSPSSATAGAVPWTIGVARLALEDAAVRFDDEAARPTATASVEGLHLETEGLELDLAPGATPPPAARLRLWLAAPGIARRIEASGTLVPLPAAPAAALKVAARGLDLAGVEGWLAASGLAGEMRAGELELALSASARLAPGGPLEASASVERLSLEDGERDLLRLEGLRIECFAATPGRAGVERLEVGAVALERLWTAVSLDAEGRPGALGVRVVGRPGAVAPPAPAASAAEAPPEWTAASEAERESGLVLALGGLRVGEVAVDLEDRRGGGAGFIPLRASAEAGAFRFDARSSAEPLPATFAARVALPGALESLSLEGSLAASPSVVRARAALAASGITGEAVRPVLASLGLEPALSDGRLAARARAEARFAPGRVDASAALERVSLSDGASGTEWIGLDAARLDGLALEGGALTVEEVAITAPRALARREPGGALLACGLRLLPGGAAAPPSRGDAPAPRTGAAAVEGPAAPGAAPASRDGAPPPAAGGPRTVEVRRVRVDGVLARIVDESRGGAAIAATASASVDAIVLGRRAPPARFRVAAAVPGTLDALVLEGGLSPDPREPSLEATLRASGIRAGPAAAFLPPGLAIDLRDGRLEADLRARAAPSEEGGRSIAASVSGIRLGEAPLDAPLLTIEAVRIAAPRLDPEGGRVAVDEVAVVGIEARVERVAGGETRLLGLRIGGAPAEAGTAGAPGAGAAGSSGAARPAASPSPAPARSSPPPSPAAAPAAAAPPAHAARRPLPLVTCERFLVDLRRIEVTDRAQPGAVPIVVKGLELKNTDPLKALGPDPTMQPYLALELSGEVAPIARLVTATARFSPFALEPELSIRASCFGVRGEGITEALPGLAATLDGRRLRDGRGHIQFVIRPNTRRRDPLDWGFLESGFGFESTIRRTWFRDGEGPVLLGIQDLRVNVARVEPRTGAVHVREVEIGRPTARIWKEGPWTYVGGIGLRAAPAPEAPSPTAGAVAGGTAPSAKGPASPAASAAPAPAPPPPAAAPGPPLVVDRFTFTDIDFQYDDRSVDPPFSLPITGLDIEAGPYGARGVAGPIPTRFEAHVRAGAVRLPKRASKDQVIGMGMVSEMIGAVAEATGAVAAKETHEKRALFEDVSVEGELALGARAAGEVRASVAGFELVDVSGLARKSGVQLSDGLFDLDLRLGLAPDGALDLSADADFTSLDLSEAADGPIASWLKLPAPLNAVLFALRDEDGRISVPVRVRLGPGGASAGELTGAIAKAVGAVAGTALANIGFRAVDTVADIGKGVVSIVPGMDAIPFMSEAASVTYAPVVVSFDPGDAAPPRSQLDALATLIAASKDDEQVVLTLEHKLGGGDYARSRVRANPSPEDRRGLVARLAARKRLALAARVDLLAEARAAMAAGLVAAAESAGERVRALDAELVEIESALDAVYELERGGAERQAGRRGRLASLGLARARLDAVRAALIAAGCPSAPGRVVVSRPRVEDAPGSEGGTVTVTATRRRKK